MTEPIKLPPEFRSGNSIPVERATITRERMVEILTEAIEAALASPEVQKQPQYETQLQVWRSTDSCLEFWSWDEADQYDYDHALPENRRIIQIIKEG